METWMEQPANIAIAAVMLLLLIWLIALQVHVAKLRKRYAAVMNVDAPVNLEEVLLKLQQQSGSIEERIARHDQQLKQLTEKLAKYKGKSAVKRFNAFSETGSDLSFALALLDERQEGIVLSGIHHREDCYIYAKPIENGTSRYKLTPEEEEVIRQAAKSG